LSPKSVQREKIKNELTIREFDWTEKQKHLISLIRDKDSKLVFISGPAGVSKSLVSVYCGLQLLNNRRVSEIIYSRPILESADTNSKLGFLPGDRDSKVEPYLYVAIQKLEELLPESEINHLVSDKRINFLEVNYCRGLSTVGKFWVIDEAQGFCFNELVTLITRIGIGSKVIICADPSQSDLPLNKQGGFKKLLEIFSDEESKKNGIQTFQFTNEDIVRSGLCKYIVEKIDKYKEVSDSFKK